MNTKFVMLFVCLIFAGLFLFQNTDATGAEDDSKTVIKVYSELGAFIVPKMNFRINNMGSGKLEPQLRITKHLDMYSQNIAHAGIIGRVIPEITIKIFHKDKGNVYARYELVNALVNRYKVQSTSTLGVPVEEIGFVFKSISWSFNSNRSTTLECPDYHSCILSETEM